MEFVGTRDDLLGRATFVAFDTETTGLWAVSNRLVEIAAVKFSVNSNEVDRFQSLVNPERPIPPDAIAVHGITDDIVKGAPLAPVALEEFTAFCGPDSILIAHNAPFDISFIGNEIDRARLPVPANLIIDTVDIFRRYVPGLVSYSLLSLSRHFGLAKKQEHRGLSDAELVCGLFRLACGFLPQIDTGTGLSHKLAVYRFADWKAEGAELPKQFSELSAAVETGSSVEIVYRSSGSGETSRIIRPFQVHRLGGVYYLVAFCELANAERTFRLDRIAHYRIL